MPAMAEEGAVLGGEEGVDQLRRKFLIGELDAPLAGEGLHRLAVDVADIGRQHRLVGEQRLGRGQAAREDQPDARRKGSDSPQHRQRQAERRTQRPRRSHGIEALANRPVEGDEVRAAAGCGTATEAFGSVMRRCTLAHGSSLARSEQAPQSLQLSDEARSEMGLDRAAHAVGDLRAGPRDWT